VVETSLKQAYNVQPYNKTLRTTALTSSNLTFTLVIPIIRQLVQTELKLRLAAFNLALIMLSGYVLLLFNITPKYLNSSTVSIYDFPILIYPLQLINIALVFPMLIFNELAVHKAYTQSNKAYNSIGEGAIRTKSSAYASMNS
jgi:hypothetical protein